MGPSSRRKHRSPSPSSSSSEAERPKKRDKSRRDKRRGSSPDRKKRRGRRALRTAARNTFDAQGSRYNEKTDGVRFHEIHPSCARVASLRGGNI